MSADLTPVGWAISIVAISAAFAVCVRSCNETAVACAKAGGIWEGGSASCLKKERVR